jgi:ABC-type multidrug transport system ATPase subunit
MIDAENVHITYEDGTEAVRGVDLDVGEGEFFGFLGPNGAGKTTTIKTLVTLLQPNQGSVTINGYDAEDDPQAVCESIGYMAQATSVDEELTARENVRFACKVYGVPASEQNDRTEELLELVGLADVADKRAANYSGGMKKRLELPPPSCIGRRWCSSTNRRPVSTPKPGCASGTTSSRSTNGGRRCFSPHSISKRLTDSATALP